MQDPSIPRANRLRALRGALVVTAVLLAPACMPGNTPPNVTPRGTLAPGQEGGKATDDAVFGVVFASPDGQTTQPAELSVAWNRPMRALVGSPTEPAPPVRLTPAVPGAWEWIGTRAVRFVPREPLPRATTFTLEVPAGTRSHAGEVMGARFAQTFTTELPRVLETSPGRGATGAKPDVHPTITFNQRIADEELRRSLSLTADGKPVSFTTRRPEPKDPRVVELVPASALPLDTEIVIKASASLVGAEGPTPAGREHVVSFRTYGPLTVTGVGCREDHGLCRPEGWVSVNLANPVKVADLRKAIVVEPAVKLRWPSWQDAETTTTSLDLDGAFLPSRRYSIRVKAQLPGGPLRDAYGQPLGKDFTTQLSFDQLEPKVQVGVSGTYLEPQQVKDVPIFSTNVSGIDVAFAPLSPDDVMTIEGRTRARRRGEDPLEPIARMPGGKRQALRGSGVKNRLDRNAIPTASILGGKEGRGAVWMGVSWQDGRTPRTETNIVQISDLGISAKTGGDDAFVWVTRLSTGKPVESAEVEVRTPGRDGPPPVFRTDARGVARIPKGTIPKEDPSAREHAPSPILVVRDGKDWAYRRLDSTLSLYRFGASECSGCDTSRGLLFTERGLYRPGDAVKLKGIVRETGEKGLTTPTGRLVAVSVKGPEGEAIDQASLTLSSFGSFSHSLTLAPTVKVGSYRVTAHFDKDKEERGWEASFEVAEYRPAEFAVTAETNRREYVRGDTLSCETHGAYLFGAPMANAEVRASVTRGSTWFSPPGVEGFSTADSSWLATVEHQSPRAGELSNQRARLDAKGRFVTSSKLDLPGLVGTETVSCEAEVTDLSRQSFAGRSSAIVHPGEIYLGVRTSDASFVKSGEAIKPEVIAVEPSGKRRAGVAAKVTLHSRTWKMVRQGAGGSRWHTELTSVDTLVASCSVTTAATPVACDLRPTSPGHHVIRVTGADARGNAVSASTDVYALGEGAVTWADNDESRVDLVPDKKSYSVGDVARILVKSPFPGAEAWVTLERKGVLSEKRMTLHGATPTIEIPITKELVPNVFVGVHLVRGRTRAPANEKGADVGAPAYRVGFAPLVIDHGARRLAASVKPKKTDYRPGETVDLEVDVKDAAGKGTAAEVTLYAVDEGVLLLSGYKTPDPLAVFFSPRPLSVSTIESREDLARIARGPVGFGPGLDKGQEGGGGGLSVRKDFRQTALFLPALHTDAAGKARASFVLPDSLSAFRVMAVVAGADDRFGSAEARVVTSKPLMARPALPRVLRAGDALDASVIVTSKGLPRGAVDVSLAVTGLVASGPAKQTIELDDGESKEVRFPVSAPRAGKAKLRFEARGAGGVVDAVEVSRDVVTPTMMESAALHGDTEGAAGESLGEVTALRDDVGGLDVTLSPSALAGLVGGIEQLVEYPYGCTEQMTSRLVPLLPLREIATAYGVKLPADLDQAVAATVAKVSANQRSDGGFGLWPESEASSPWLTAYALWGLGEARRRGLPVRPAVIEAATRYLRGSLGKDPVADAFSVDVLAELDDPDPGAADVLFSRRADLPLFAKALLLHAMARGKSPDAAQAALVTELEQAVRLDGSAAHVVVLEQGRYRDYLDSDTRTEALVLRALAVARPKHALLSRLAVSLVDARRGGHWRTTQETAWALLALDAYRKAQELAPPRFDARVFLGQALLAEGSFRDPATVSVRHQIPMAALANAGGSVLAFEKRNGPGHLFYEARLRFARKEGPRTAVDAGFFVDKAMTVVAPETLEAALRSSVRGVPDAIGAGEMVLVDLTVVTTSPRDYVVIDDPLPAGLEAVDASLKGAASWQSLGQREAASEDDDETGGRSWWWVTPLTRKELRDDRVVFFVDHLPSGVYHYRYLARATSIGRFARPATRAEEMYVPETFGHTASGVLSVVAR